MLRDLRPALRTLPLVLTAIGTPATLLPARRATAIDPARALQAE